MNPIPEELGTVNPALRTAVLIVAGEDSAPDRSFDAIRHYFGGYYEQIIFMTIGLVDYQVMDDVPGSQIGTAVRHTAQGAVTTSLNRALRSGMSAVTCVAIGTDPAEEVERLSLEVVRRFPTAMFFLGKLVFQNQKWYHPLLHSRMGDAIQRRLERRGLPVTILPVVVPA
ncbi:MAG TPA: hypothetical protein VNM14_19800 [Planctomycetota bacterium]|nr:hypothetical protein [Planctomycetota bacterium]